MNTLKNILTAFIISTLGFAFTTSATPFDLWNWEVNSAFTDFAPGGGDVIGVDENDWWDDSGFAPTKLYWGCETSTCPDPIIASSEISSLDVSSGTSGEVKGTDLMSGDEVITATLVHSNNPIYGDTLTSATLSTKLFLTPSPVPAVLNTTIPPLLFDIVFTETPNSVAGDCSYFGDAEEGVTLPLCKNDIFVVTGFGEDDGMGDVVYDPFTNTFNQQFDDGMYTYNVGIVVDTLAPLADEVCARVGTGDPGCIGVTTLEEMDNTFHVRMTITQVPEPSTILLLSLALFGIAGSMRNKHI